MFNQKKEPTQKPGSIDEFKEMNEGRQRLAKDAGAYEKSSESDKYARMLMTGYNLFRPLVVASLFSNETGADNDLLFDFTDDKAIQNDAIEDVVNRLTVHWNRTQQLVNQLCNNFEAAGVDIYDPDNRWMLRLIMRSAADNVGNAALNGQEVDIEKLKEASSAVLTLLTKRDIDGISDPNIKKKLLESTVNVDETLKEVLEEQEKFVTMDDTTSTILAMNSAFTKFTETLNDEFNYNSSPERQAEIASELTETAIECGAAMFKVAIYIDKNGKTNTEHARDINETTRRQLMMRCMGDATTLVNSTLAHYARKARRHILSAPQEERSALNYKYFKEGPPLEQIKYDVKMTRRALNDSARYAVPQIAKLLNVELVNETDAKQFQEKAEQTANNKTEANQAKKTNANEEGNDSVQGVGYER